MIKKSVNSNISINIKHSQPPLNLKHLQYPGFRECFVFIRFKTYIFALLKHYNYDSPFFSEEIPIPV